MTDEFAHGRVDITKLQGFPQPWISRMPAPHRMTMLRARAKKLRDTIALKQKEYEKISRSYEADLAEVESLFGTSDINEIEKICVKNLEDIKISMKYFENIMDEAKLILNITDQ